MFLLIGFFVCVCFELDLFYIESGFYFFYERGIENFGIFLFVVIFCVCLCFRYVRVIRKFVCFIYEGYVVFVFFIMF